LTQVLIAVTAASHWTLKDGTNYPCGYWPEELAVAHRVFRESGAATTIGTPGGVTPTPDQAGMTEEWATYLDTIRFELAQPAELETINPDHYDMLYVPGGYGPMQDLAFSPAFGNLVRTMFETGKPVSAVCHGPAAFLPAQKGDGSWLFSGFRMTCFTNREEADLNMDGRAPWLAEDRLKEEGGVFSAADELWGAHVVADHNLYTGQNPASVEPLTKALLAEVAHAEADRC
jgi:putative intracellular protease/amidase